MKVLIAALAISGAFRAGRVVRIAWAVWRRGTSTCPTCGNVKPRTRRPKDEQEGNA